MYSETSQQFPFETPYGTCVIVSNEFCWIRSRGRVREGANCRAIESERLREAEINDSENEEFLSFLRSIFDRSHLSDQRFTER